MILLASTSPTRAKILRDCYIDFVQKPIDFDEDSIQTQDPKEFAYLAAKGKFENALKTFGNQLPILVADTTINVSGILQRKAKDIYQAKSMLQAQSNQTIQILTCLIYQSCELELIDISTTTYQFDKFATQDLESYLNSQDWQGKAGCVMVEGFHKKYIKSQKGLESTALGLSIEKILPFLETI